MLRMFIRRVRDEKKPILDLLIHYERLAGFALEYRWHAVRKYHSYVTEEVNDGRMSWVDQVKVEDAVRYLNSKGHLTDRDKQERDREREDKDEGPRDQDQRGRPQKRKDPMFRNLPPAEDPFRDPYRFSSEPGKKRGTCRLFNFDRGG